MRRLQSNLAYLAAIADRTHKPASHIPPSPAIMTSPSHLPRLTDTYKKLATLFPGSPIPASASKPSASASGNASANTSLKGSPLVMGHGLLGTTPPTSAGLGLEPPGSAGLGFPTGVMGNAMGVALNQGGHLSGGMQSHTGATQGLSAMGSALGDPTTTTTEKNYQRWLDEMGGATAETDTMEREHHSWLHAQASINPVGPQQAQQMMGGMQVSGVGGHPMMAQQQQQQQQQQQGGMMMMMGGQTRQAGPGMPSRFNNGAGVGVGMGMGFPPQ